VPREVTLEPLSRESAIEILAATLHAERAQVIGYLEVKRIADLIR